MTVSVKPLGEALGAELVGLDLSRPLDDAAFASVKKALLDNVVLVISDLPPDTALLLDLTRPFGRLVPHILTQYHHPDTAEISVIRSNVAGDAKSRVTQKPAGAYWHSDLSYDASPSDCTFLYSVDVPARGGDTRFANMYLAYETLPEATKRRIEGRTAIHRYGWNGGAATPPLTEEQRARHPDVEHAVVRVHPETGRKALFVNPGFTMRIVGLVRTESDELLNTLFAHALRPEFQYRHKWRNGQLVGMDNRACMHCATPDYAEPRTLFRFIVGGPRIGVAHQAA